MQNVLAVALGGACGALARYGAGLLVGRFVDSPFPWGTWAVNLVGCLLIGVAAAALGAADVGREVRLFLVVGVLGAFTTFSTYSLDTLSLVAEGNGALALLNAAGSVVAGLALVWAGRALGQWLIAGG
jgi:CrcB protein